MNVATACAERRANEDAIESARLRGEQASLRRIVRSKQDTIDELQVQNNELRRLLGEERDGKLSMIETIAKMGERETALRAGFQICDEEKRGLEELLRVATVEVEQLRHVLKCNGLLEFTL